MGALVVKVRHGDRAGEKTDWCAARLPLLGTRALDLVVLGFDCFRIGGQRAAGRLFAQTAAASVTVFSAILDRLEAQSRHPVW
jgi:hypothetical protein